jgi:hypothetical protein
VGIKNILFIVLASSIEENAALGSEIDPKDLKKRYHRNKDKIFKNLKPFKAKSKRFDIFTNNETLR